MTSQTCLEEKDKEGQKIVREVETFHSIEKQKYSTQNVEKEKYRKFKGLLVTLHQIYKVINF